MGNLLDQTDILELIKIAQQENPANPDGYGLPFAHLEALVNEVLPANPPLDGEIALLGLKWPGFNLKGFNTLTRNRSDFGTSLNPEEEITYQAGHAFLSAVGSALPIIRTLAELNATVSPWDRIHDVVKSVDQIGLPPVRIPVVFIKQIRK